ncbi:hypothetical protein [Streptomyces sp. NPDC060194]|uniref:hypothetical protein n=1 Tax=Streptomyces sp. NPDC060194 TaxID=3347069 RepID=UPI003656FB71
MPTTAPQTPDELLDALRENDERPYGRARTITAEELVDAAEQFVDQPLLLVHALLELQEAYTYGSEPRKSPVVFARLLNLFDEQPELFDEGLRFNVFWRFKWVSNALRSLPEVPLASLRQWLGEMRDRYEAAGLDLQPYYGQAYQLAAHVGEGDTLAYELWAGRARTRLSDCEACEICDRARYHAAAGDDERALRVWEPVLAGKESCQEEPARSFSYALLPLLRTGRAEQARELHLAGYRTARRRASMAPEVGRHLEFCALTGNEARGLELLAENRSLFEEVESPSAQLAFLTGVEVLLRRVEHLGHGELPAAGYAGRAWTATGLREEVQRRADDLAARFDARNGTSRQADARRERLERAPLVASLELTLRQRDLGDLSAPDAPVPAPASRPVPALPESTAELVLRARALQEQGHPDAAACWERLRSLVASRDYAHPQDPGVGPLVELRADLLDEAAGRAGRRDEHAEAAELYEEAAELYGSVGATERAAVARACGILAAAELAAAEPAAEGDPAAERAATFTAAHEALVALHEGTPGLAPQAEARLLRLRATSLGLRLQASGSGEHLAPALAEVDRLGAFAARHAVGSQMSNAHLLRASTHAVAGDLPAAAAELDVLVALLDAEGPAWHLPRTHAFRGRIRLGLGEPEQALADLDLARRLGADWPAEFVDAARTHGDLAEACMRLGRPDEALRHLVRSAELDLRHGSRTDAFCTYSNAANLSLDLGRVEDCIALLDSLLAEREVMEGELDDRLVAQLRLTRARALHAGGDLKAAVAEFVALAAESESWDDDLGAHVMIAGEAATLLAESGAFDEAGKAADQALAAHARLVAGTTDSAPRFEQLSGSLREVARLQAQAQGADGLDDALARLADAGRVAGDARAASFEAHGRSLDTALAYEYGRVHAYAGAYEDALVDLERALSLLGEPGEDADRAGEWAECHRLAGVVEGVYLERTAPALARVDAAVTRLTALGHADAAESLTALGARLRDE